MKNLIHKIIHWEYWPFNILYIPVYPYFVWQMIKRKSFFYFTASNPTIDFGGMLGESKWEIFELIPQKYLPVTVKLTPGITTDEVLQTAAAKELTYPFILKPDVGERGWMVKKITNREELAVYLENISVDFLLQEFIPYPMELGVFYYRMPTETSGRVSSVVVKEMLSVTGNGENTVAQLIHKNPRARFQEKTLKENLPENFLNSVLPAGEVRELVSIGNHCKGTKFLNGADLIDEKLTAAMDQLSMEIPGFYFGRIDLRCQSINDLKELRNFKILELNGAGSEPGHIYQPGYSLFRAYRDIYHHIRVLSDVSHQNKKKGIAYWSTARGLEKIKWIRAYNKSKPF